MCFAAQLVLAAGGARSRARDVERLRPRPRPRAAGGAPGSRSTRSGTRRASFSICAARQEQRLEVRRALRLRAARARTLERRRIERTRDDEQVHARAPRDRSPASARCRSGRRRGTSAPERRAHRLEPARAPRRGSRRAARFAARSAWRPGTLRTRDVPVKRAQRRRGTTAAVPASGPGADRRVA